MLANQEGDISRRVEASVSTAGLMCFCMYPYKIFSEDDAFAPMPIFTERPIAFDGGGEPSDDIVLSAGIVRGDWDPLKNLEQNGQLSERLLTEGEYNEKVVDYSISRLGFYRYFGPGNIVVSFRGSPRYEDVSGEGKTEVEATINAAVNFTRKRELLRRDDFSAIARFRDLLDI